MVKKPSYLSQPKTLAILPGTETTDRKWIDALKPYLGGGIVPVYTNPDGTVNAARTIDNFCLMKGARKIGPNGEYL